MCEALSNCIALTPEQEKHHVRTRSCQCTIIVCVALAILSIVFMVLSGNTDEPVSFYAGHITFGVLAGIVLLACIIYACCVNDDEVI